jgi:hypothetical protein
MTYLGGKESITSGESFSYGVGASILSPDAGAEAFGLDPATVVYVAAIGLS